MRYMMILLVVALGSTAANAHPGRTASDGCHYCRTNCSSWGVPQNQRHCHYKADPPSLEEGLLKVSTPSTERGVSPQHSHSDGHSHSHQHSDSARDAAGSH